MKPILCASLVLLLAGCGSEPRGTLTGTVTKDGTPVTGAMVVFENIAQGRSVNVSVDETGAFVAKSEGNDGLLTGSYNIAVRPDSFTATSDEPPLVEAGASSTSEASTKIPKKYQSPETSGLSVSIVEGENPPLAIDLAK